MAAAYGDRDSQRVLPIAPIRNQFSGEQPTSYMSLHPVEDVGYGSGINVQSYASRGNDAVRTANLHSITTDFHGQQRREDRYQGESNVVAAYPVTFERKIDPNKFLDAPEIHRQVDVKVIDKAVDRIVEVFQRKQIVKVADRMVETIAVQDIEEVKEFQVTQIIPEVQIIDKEVFFDREVLEELVEEVYIDKYVERVVEVLREVPYDKIVERRIEVIKEIPVVRYVDRVVTREIPVVQVVERVVEILKERPVEVIKEVPVYVRRDASELETRTTTSYEKVSGAQSFSYEARHSQQSQAMIGQVRGWERSASPARQMEPIYQQQQVVQHVTREVPRTVMTQAIVNTTVAKAGVGMVLERESNGEIFVRKLMKGSPAANAGSIQINDKLLTVDSNNVQGMLLDRVFDMINGPEGSQINMTLVNGNGGQYNVMLIRGQVRN